MRMMLWRSGCRSSTSSKWYESCSVVLSVGLLVFFQAEDGIRDICVTGVQTCALPIYGHGIVEGHPVADSPAAVMAADVETLEAEVAHHLDLIECHRPFRVGLVVGGALGLGGVTVPAQIGGDYRELFGEARGDEVPHDVSLGAAVEQQQRRPAAAVTDPYRRLGGVDSGKPKTLEHEDRSLRSLVARLLDVLDRAEDEVGHLLGVRDAHRVGGALDLYDLAGSGTLGHEAV